MFVLMKGGVGTRVEGGLLCGSCEMGAETLVEDGSGLVAPASALVGSSGLGLGGQMRFVSGYHNTSKIKEMTRMMMLFRSMNVLTTLGGLPGTLARGASLLRRRLRNVLDIAERHKAAATRDASATSQARS